MKFLLAFVAALVLAAGLVAQTPAKPQQPTPQQPTFKAGVNFVRVDVYPSIKGQIVADLKQDELEVLEDGVPQRIETFEHIVTRAPGTVSERAEPRSQEESNEMAADPRARLFVLFFDTLHTAGYKGQSSFAAGYDPRTVGRALATFLEQLIGPDDLVGLMRPEMRVDTLVFTRRPSSFADFLLTGGEWQKRFLQGEMDETERKYEICYMSPEEGDIAGKMIARRRELLAIDGIRSLVAHLESLREGRKSVILVSEGWTLFNPDKNLARPLRGQMPGPPAIGVLGGKPTLGGDQNESTMMRAECERDRIMFAGIDNEKEFKLILDEANRANVSFYTLSPAGLSVQSDFNRRGDSLTSLATATDGIRIPQSNDYASVLQRIRDDVSSYYLLGYNSTNAKFDGKFRAITVRVKRPGVTVRARRGYLAPTEAEVAARARAGAPADPEVQRRENALSLLGTERPDQPFRIVAGYAFDVAAAGGPPRPVFWVTGELDAAAARTMEWSGGGEATIAVTAANGQDVATEHATITTAVPRFTVQPAETRLPPGDYLVKVRLVGKSGGAANVGSQVRVTVPNVEANAASSLGSPMLFRRGPYTGAGPQPTADLRFRKAERIRVDVPVAGQAESVTAQLLDRRGQSLPIPVTTGQRDDGARRFVTAEITLAPLAPGDYLIEVSVRRGERTVKVVTAFRIVP
jgi:VWFA-related protein